MELLRVFSLVLESLVVQKYCPGLRAAARSSRLLLESLHQTTLQMAAVMRDMQVTGMLI